MSSAMTSTTTYEGRIAALDDAIKVSGGIVVFARRIGVTHQAVYHWKKRGWAPLKRALAIEAISGIDRSHFIEPALARALSAPKAAYQTSNADGGDQ